MGSLRPSTRLHRGPPRLHAGGAAALAPRRMGRIHSRTRKGRRCARVDALVGIRRDGLEQPPRPRCRGLRGRRVRRSRRYPSPHGARRARPGAQRGWDRKPSRFGTIGLVGDAEALALSVRRRRPRCTRAHRSRPPDRDHGRSGNARTSFCARVRESRLAAPRPRSRCARHLVAERHRRDASRAEAWAIINGAGYANVAQATPKASHS
ncbi:hypothetical protein BH09MYX1_BH09MYX1_00450 [soil metagenome]